MNKLDKSFLELMEKILSSGSYKYNDVQKDILDFIKQKYVREYKIFHIAGKEYTDQRERDRIFLISPEKLILTKKGKQHKKKIEKDLEQGYNEDDLDLEDYKDESKFIIGLGELGHSIYDKLKQQELNDLTQETISKQTNIIDNQQNSLNNTFWVYVLIAIVMGFEVILRFLESRLRITTFSNLIYAILIVILVYLYFFIIHQFEGTKVKFKGVKLLVSSIFVFLILIGAIIFAGSYLPGQIAWKDEKLIEKQEKLVEKQLESVTPKKPQIDVKLNYPDDRKIAIWDIADIRRYQDGSEYFQKQKIRFVLSNVGGMDSGPINANLNGPFMKERHEYLSNLTGGESKYLEFDVWYKECWRDIETQTLENGTEVERYVVDPRCNYETEDILLGWQQFNLTIDCSFCEQEQIHYFDFCVFNNSDSSREVCNKKQ